MSQKFTSGYLFTFEGGAIHKDKPIKQLLQDWQWNQNLLLLKWLKVKLSGWKTSY